MTGEAPPGGGPTVRRILLGSQLRRLREAREITRDQAGYAIRASESKISRMELGRVPFKERDVADLLTLYQVTDDAERAPLLALANAANVPGWWHRYGDVLADWFQPYLGLEEAASIVRTYEVQFVPGLLQTPGYARAVIAVGNPGAPAAEIERRAAMRMARQEVLTRPAPPRLWAVIDEAALRRPIGGAAVMRAQLRTYPTWSTLSTSPARSTWTSAATLTSTCRTWSACAPRLNPATAPPPSWPPSATNSDSSLPASGRPSRASVRAKAASCPNARRCNAARLLAGAALRRRDRVPAPPGPSEPTPRGFGADSAGPGVDGWRGRGPGSGISLCRSSGASGLVDRPYVQRGVLEVWQMPVLMHVHQVRMRSQRQSHVSPAPYCTLDSKR